MKIVSWNLLHREGATLAEIERLIRQERPDLLLLQEATQEIGALASRVGGHVAWNPLPGRRHGLAAWSPQALRQLPVALTLEPGLLVRRVCQIVELGEFTAANVHLSHGQLLNRRQLRHICNSLPPRALVVGDCNMVGPFRHGGFHDVGPRSATHRAARLLPLRLDRCFVRDLDCTQARLLDRGASDHHPILVELFARPNGQSMISPANSAHQTSTG